VSTTPGNPGNLLEISWKLIGPPGNFCVRCRRSTALVSSHKNMEKIQNLSPSDVFFQVPDAPKPVFGRSSTPDPCGGAYDAPPDSYSAGEGTPRAEIPILWVFQLSVSPPKEAEARQTCPGFFLKSLLESPGNLLEICLIKFVDTLQKVKSKGRYSSSWEPHLRAMGRHLPYGITQCYLPLYTSERTPPEPQPCRLVLDLPTQEGWKAELT